MADATLKQLAQRQLADYDVTIATVTGAELTRTVVDSLAWLARQPSLPGEGLQARQTVLCGSIADLFPVSTECQISVTTDRFGSVACSIARPTII